MHGRTVCLVAVPIIVIVVVLSLVAVHEGFKRCGGPDADLQAQRRYNSHNYCIRTFHSSRQPCFGVCCLCVVCVRVRTPVAQQPSAWHRSGISQSSLQCFVQRVSGHIYTNHTGWQM